MKNLLKNRPIYHRELFNYDITPALPVDQFTTQDVWNYFNLLFFGPRFYTSTNEIPSKEELIEQRKKIINQFPPMTTAEEMFIEGLSDRYGVEPVLISIDLYHSEGGGAPHIESIAHYIITAISQLNRKKLEPEME